MLESLSNLNLRRCQEGNKRGLSLTEHISNPKKYFLFTSYNELCELSIVNLHRLQHLPSQKKYPQYIIKQRRFIMFAC